MDVYHFDFFILSCSCSLPLPPHPTHTQRQSTIKKCHAENFQQLFSLQQLKIWAKYNIKNCPLPPEIEEQTKLQRPFRAVVATFPKPRALKLSYSKEPEDTSSESQRARLAWAQGPVSQWGGYSSSGLVTLLWHESRLAVPLNPRPIQQSWLLWSLLLPKSSQSNVAPQLLLQQPQHRGYNWIFTSMLAAQGEEVGHFCLKGMG